MSEPSLPTDPDRFDGWVRDHGKAVWGYVFALVGRRELADELAQQVFCRAWEARTRYREQGTARAYLLRIADRLACDVARRPDRTTPVGDDWGEREPTADDDPAEDALAAERRQRLAEALQRLSPVQRRVLLLRYYGPLGFAEIAAVVHRPLGTVLSDCRRGLEALRKLLADVAP